MSGTEKTVKILKINPGSDGDGRKWPKHHYTRNDAYFMERIASDKWIHDLGGARPGITYRLDRLPQGYAGFERARADTKHIDRYIYGHPNGQFRSLNEYYPHFKHLMDYGGPANCECKLCKGGNGKKRSGISRAAGSAEPKQPGQASAVPKDQLISPIKPRAHGEPESKKRKLVDAEGVPDVYEALIQKLRDAGPEGGVDEPINERMSPDWRTSHSMSKEVLSKWQELPRYVPRVGEIVLFVRKLKDGEVVAWHPKAAAFTLKRRDSDTWLEQPRWEAGVVTQMPKEAVSDQDLIHDDGKERAVNESGFRVEPLSRPGDDYKPYTKQHKYLPLHAMRPFCLWSECLTGVSEEDWHPSVHHALTVTNSFCVIGRYRFKGVWPDATAFSRGVYIGSELIMVGDTVRLLPRKNEQRDDAVTDVMVVTGIRLRFVNLNMEEDDMTPVPLNVPYQTCLHISGKVYTSDPTRSFDGVGKISIDPQSNILPAGLGGYGPWYHYTDPKETSVRVELPFTRVMGRCYEDTAMKAWFSSQAPVQPSSSFKAVNTKSPIFKNGLSSVHLSQSLESIIEARNYSLQRDGRIKLQEGKAWFWADTRIEQLDLHEVNNQFVGVKDGLRDKGQMAKWRASLKALGGNTGALVELAAKRQQEEQEQVKAQSSYGMVAASARLETESGTEAEGEPMGDGAQGEEEEEDEDDAMEVDDRPAVQTSNVFGTKGSPTKAVLRQTGPTVLDDSDDEDEAATNQLAGELARNIRSNDPRLSR
ncbi:hypothetical protein LTR37_010331 [Vermiconidia calcicola]|uniref:Uncharacterized protein n=1 Tax=Vermiconidia calcicola TaxID=1690605 RepID=A0ACC3N5I4_9PEZI|nr:hypothetical protein LTR37_010331 [Vermiconidia calcicola]